MFLAFPTIGPIESHPFTMASVAEAPQSVAFSTENQVKKNEFELTWIVRVRDGFTKRLKEHILMKNQRQIELGTEGSLTMQLPIFMDGPYGAPPDISRFETCVFFGGEYQRLHVYSIPYSTSSRRVWCCIYTTEDVGYSEVAILVMHLSG